MNIVQEIPLTPNLPLSLVFPDVISTLNGPKKKFIKITIVQEEISFPFKLKSLLIQISTILKFQLNFICNTNYTIFVPNSLVDRNFLGQLPFLD